MIKYLPYEEKYQDQMYDVFNELTKEEVFFKKLTKEEFSDKLFKNPNFKKEGTFLALEGNKLVGFASGSVKDTDKENPNASGYIHTFIVRKEYRRQGIGSKLYDMLEKYFKDNGRNSARFVFLSGICWNACCENEF